MWCRRWHRLLWLPALLAVTALADVTAEPSVWPSDHLFLLSVESAGLRGRPRRAAADGSRGLWIAGHHELVRWSPAGVVERHLAEDTAWMIDGRVTHLATGAGTVWFGTPAGIGRLGPGAPAWFGPASGLPDQRITTLEILPTSPAEAVAGTWRGLARSGPSGFFPLPPSAPVLSVAVGGDRVVAAVPGSLPDCGSSASPEVGPGGAGTIMLSSGGTLWAGGRDLWSCDGDSWRRIATAPGGVLGITEARDGTMWVGCGKGIFFLSEGRLRPAAGPATAIVSLGSQDAGVLAGTSGDGLWDCSRDGCERRPGMPREAHVVDVAVLGADAWVTTQRGLYQCRPGCELFEHPELAAAGDPGPVVIEGDVVWVGSPGGGGIIRISGPDEVDRYTPERRLPDADINTLLPGQDGLWLATDAGLVQYTGSQFIPRGPGQTAALSLQRDDQGRLWGGDREGLWLTETGGTPKQRLPLPIHTVRALELDGAGRLWAGGPEGLVELNVDAADLSGATLVDHTPHLPSHSVRDIATDVDGSVWVATSGGLGVWTDGAWQRFSTAEGLPSNVVWAVHADSRGGIWVGTYGGGAARFDGEGFRPLNSSQGMPSNVVRQILSDGAGNVWLVTDLGLASVAIDGLPDLRGSALWNWLIPGSGLLLAAVIFLKFRGPRP